MELGSLKVWCSAFFARYKRKRRPAYADLLAERDRLKQIVLYWRYPDGSLVPQGGRQRLFHVLRSIDRDIAAHPDNPNHHGEEHPIPGAAREYSDSGFR